MQLIDHEVAKPVERLDPETYVDSPRAGQILGLSHSYLRKLRIYGGGPRFATMGRLVRYRVGDLLDFAAARRVESTAERKAA